MWKQLGNGETGTTNKHLVAGGKVIKNFKSYSRLLDKKQFSRAWTYGFPYWKGRTWHSASQTSRALGTICHRQLKFKFNKVNELKSLKRQLTYSHIDSKVLNTNSSVSIDWTCNAGWFHFNVYKSKIRIWIWRRCWRWCWPFLYTTTTFANLKQKHQSDFI